MHQHTGDLSRGKRFPTRAHGLSGETPNGPRGPCQACAPLRMQGLLEDDSYQAITTTTHPRRVLDLYREIHPDLIVLTQSG